MRRSRQRRAEIVPSFTYRGRARGGQLVTGELEGDTAAAVAARLSSIGVTPLDVHETRGAELTVGDVWRRLGGGGPKLADLILFARQMHTITRAGVPLLKGLGGLADTTHNRVLSDVLRDMIDSLEGGRELSAAMARHERVFGSLFVSIVRVGEQTGTLPEAFLRIYEYLRIESRIRERIKSAVRYPLMVIVALGFALALISLWVLPKFEPLFASLESVPLPTRVLMGTSAWISSHWGTALAGVVALIVAFRYWISTPDGRLVWDRRVLSLPVIGATLEKALLARVSRSFAVIFTAGVPLVQGLNTVAATTGNAHLGRQVLRLREGVERGEALSHTARSVGIFPPLVLQMIAVGEETGALPELLGEVAEFYEREVDYELDNLSAAIEPLLILAVAGLVLVLALGVFLPLWDMAAGASAF
jgi:MSHA biogenesis protein MshG